VIQQRKMIDTSEGDNTHRRRLGQHLEAMLALCETVECRRGGLLAYFGETLTQPCGNCDTCLTPPESWDGTVAAQKFLSAVFRLDRERRQRFGAGQVIDILLGRKTAKVIQHDHDGLTVFGIGEDLNESEWRGVARQLLAQGLLAVEGDYGTLSLTEASADVLGASARSGCAARPPPSRPGPPAPPRPPPRPPTSRPRPPPSSSSSGPGAPPPPGSRACRPT